MGTFLGPAVYQKVGKDSQSGPKIVIRLSAEG
jgi:hypothetical protein